MDQILPNQIGWMNAPLFQIGENAVTLGGIGVGLVVIFATIMISRLVQRIVFRQLSANPKLPKSVIYAINRIINYCILIIGILIASESLGLKLSSLTVLFGFLGIGIGFGMQNVTSNFISGLILLIERPIGVGDLVQIKDNIAEVLSINMRSTTIRTFDNVTIVVPNSKFIENEVTNLTVDDPRVRLHCPVGVAYGSDEQKVKETLLQVARDNKDVLKQPVSEVRFLEFGDSSLNFELLVWVSDPGNQKTLHSNINFAISKAFRDNDIKIPFPQRDLHIQMTPAIDQLTRRSKEV